MGCPWRFLQMLSDCWVQRVAPNVYFLAAPPWGFPSSKNHLGIYIHNYYIITTAHICILPACCATDHPRAKYWCNRRLDSRLICGLSNRKKSLQLYTYRLSDWRLSESVQQNGCPVHKWIWIQHEDPMPAILMVGTSLTLQDCPKIGSGFPIVIHRRDVFCFAGHLEP